MLQLHEILVPFDISESQQRLPLSSLVSPCIFIDQAIPIALSEIAIDDKDDHRVSLPYTAQ